MSWEKILSSFYFCLLWDPKKKTCDAMWLLVRGSGVNCPDEQKSVAQSHLHVGAKKKYEAFNISIV